VNAAALLTDGSVVTVRELGPNDVSALLELHRGLPVEDRYMRFFSTSPRQLEDFVERMISPDAPRHVVLGAFHENRLLGAASYVDRLRRGRTCRIAHRTGSRRRHPAARTPGFAGTR
jgi:hypothetical protein